MPRGFKRDVVDSGGMFFDKRSFISLPKPSDHGPIHFILYGKDVTNVRCKIYARDRGRCQLRISKHCTGERVIGFENCHLEHRLGGLSQRCWCDANLRISCPSCHIIKDGRYPRWTSKEKPGLATASRPGEIQS